MYQDELDLREKEVTPVSRDHQGKLENRERQEPLDLRADKVKGGPRV